MALDATHFQRYNQVNVVINVVINERKILWHGANKNGYWEVIEKRVSMKILDFEEFVKDLPQISDIPDLHSFSANGLGVAAFENEKMVGFLCGCDPFDNAFRATDVRGVFSPMGANAVVSENRSKIYAAMYQEAAKNGSERGLFLMPSAYMLMMNNRKSSFFIMALVCDV